MSEAPYGHFCLVASGKDSMTSNVRLQTLIYVSSFQPTEALQAPYPVPDLEGKSSGKPKLGSQPPAMSLGIEIPVWKIGYYYRKQGHEFWWIVLCLNPNDKKAMLACNL